MNVIKCSIDGWIYYISKDQITVFDEYAIIQLPSDILFYVFPDSETAGEVAKEYWETLSESDSEEFISLVGSENILKWSKGEYAGPGSTQVESLEEWFDLWLDTPEEHFASYDGAEHSVYFDLCNRLLGFQPNGQKITKYTDDDLNDQVEEMFGFIPTVAYRS